MSELVRLSTPSVTVEQKKYLVDIRKKAGTAINTQIRQLIQKAMEESKAVNNEMV